MFLNEGGKLNPIWGLFGFKTFALLQHHIFPTLSLCHFWNTFSSNLSTPWKLTLSSWAIRAYTMGLRTGGMTMLSILRRTGKIGTVFTAQMGYSHYNNGCVEEEDEDEKGSAGAQSLNYYLSRVQPHHRVKDQNIGNKD